MTDVGRSRRTGKESKSKTEVYAELIKQRRAGGRVGLKEEWEDEEDVYDVLEESQYADVVAKRREEGGQHCHAYDMLSYSLCIWMFIARDGLQNSLYVSICSRPHQH